jgi:hypothetical protein
MLVKLPEKKPGFKLPRQSAKTSPKATARPAYGTKKAMKKTSVSPIRKLVVKAKAKVKSKASPKGRAVARKKTTQKLKRTAR